MKRPAFQFYPGDWRRDTELQSCSIGARGLWHEMLCIMHECDPYGHLTLKGEPMPVEKLARLAKLTTDECQAYLGELEAVDVFSRTRANVIYSRRMVRDEAARNGRAKGGPLGASHGKRGGRPKNPSTGENANAEGFLKTPSGLETKPLSGGKPNPLHNPPSSSSSSSDSELSLTPSLPSARAEETSGLVGWLLDYLRNPNLAVQRGLAEIVREWRATGLSDTEIRACITRQVEQRRTGEPDWCPDSIRYLTPGIKQAAAARSRDGAGDGALPANPDDERVAGFKARGFWHESWGDRPDQPGCEIAVSILRKHGYRS